MTCEECPFKHCRDVLEGCGFCPFDVVSENPSASMSDFDHD